MSYIVAWTVIADEAFEAALKGLALSVQDELLARARLLQTYGPGLGRPYADTLAGSRHANMKELRFEAGGGVWRVAFAFDPERRAVLLAAGDKAGVSGKLFYRRLLRIADARFDRHLKGMARRGEEE